jgi:hypothetical protein
MYIYIAWRALRSRVLSHGRESFALEKCRKGKKFEKMFAIYYLLYKFCRY